MDSKGRKREFPHHFKGKRWHIGEIRWQENKKQWVHHFIRRAIRMSQFDEFLKEVEGLAEKEIKVLVVTGKPGSGKSKVLREAAETKGWDYIDTRLLITEDFLKLLPSERRVNAPEVLKNELLSHHGDVVMLDRIQTLFIPVFNIDPKSVLDELGRAFTVVIAWPGYVKDGLLCYDKFDGTESIRISAADYTLWTVE